MATIEDLYKYFSILDEAKENAGNHVDVYTKIIGCTKQGAKEKQLASQFITRFFKYFSSAVGSEAIDAIFDLCEDDDINIRKQAIKDLSTICRDCPEHLNRIADILTQLLQTTDTHESLQVQNSLLAVFKQDPKVTLTEIFHQITDADLEEVRKKAIKFLVQKIPTMDTKIFNKDVEEFLIKEIKKVLVDVDAEEFELFSKLLSTLPSMSTVPGRQELVNIIIAQCEIDKPIDDSNIGEKVMILLSCTQKALPLFSKNVPSTRLLVYYLDNLIPAFNKLNIDENVKLELLKCFAEMSPHAQSTIENLNDRLNKLFDLLLVYLPRPVENVDSNDETKFNFSFVECLMYSFHQLGRHATTDILTVENQKERLKDFRIRLQYFATGTQNYIKELRNTIVNNDESQENKVRKVALKVTTNIDVLIKDLFHNPPSYKSTITLSWKQDDKHDSASGVKRSLSNDRSDDLRKKPDRDVYHPPSGKYSTTNTNGNTKNGHQNGNGNNNNNNNNGNFGRSFANKKKW